MFDISFMEILIISMVALIVVGPERLPQVARTLGHLFGRCRNFVYGIKTDIHNEIRMEELKKMHASVHETAQDIEHSFRQEIDELKSVSDIASLEKVSATVQAEVKSSVDSSPTSSSSPSQQQTLEVDGAKQADSDKEQK